MGFMRVLAVVLALGLVAPAGFVRAESVKETGRDPAAAKKKKSKKSKKTSKAGAKKKSGKATAKKTAKKKKKKSQPKSARAGTRSHAPMDYSKAADHLDIPDNLKDDLPPPNNGDLSD